MKPINKAYLSLLTAVAAATAAGQNPIVPQGMYMADPSAISGKRVVRYISMAPATRLLTIIARMTMTCGRQTI